MTELSRTEALALAERRKAARRRRTGRIRRWIVAISAAAFIGPFGLIYAQTQADTTLQVASSKQTTTSTPVAVTTQQS